MHRMLLPAGRLHDRGDCASSGLLQQVDDDLLLRTLAAARKLLSGTGLGRLPRLAVRLARGALASFAGLHDILHRVDDASIGRHRCEPAEAEERWRADEGWRS